MFDSVLVARDRWLKESGAMFPSHAKMYLAPIRTGTSAQKHADYEDSCAGWDEFSDQTLQNYGVDMRALTETFEQEQREFFLNTSAWVDEHPSQLLGPPCVLKAIDLHTVTLEEMKALDVPFNLRVIGASGPAGPAEVGAFCGWFDVSFKGSDANPNETNVELTTAPDANGATHWGQQAFYLQPTLSATDGSVIKGSWNSSANRRTSAVRPARDVEAGRGRGGRLRRTGRGRADERVAHRVTRPTRGSCSRRAMWYPSARFIPNARGRRSRRCVVRKR